MDIHAPSYLVEWTIESLYGIWRPERETYERIICDITIFVDGVRREEANRIEMKLWEHFLTMTNEA